MMRKLNKQEMNLFLSICLPMIKDSASEAIRGRLYYALKHNSTTERDLEEAFPLEYAGVLEKIQEKPFFGFLAKKNYVLEYFFEKHNKVSSCPVVVADIIGFKAERRGKDNFMKAMVKYGDGRTEKSSLEVFPNVSMQGLNLHDRVLVHKNTVCHKLSEREYEQLRAYV